jgi:D-hydroxyproline dehydrogenase subunit alpha
MATERLELLIIGGGPAGMAAALEARRAGVAVALLEERSALGGQIYRATPAAFSVSSEERAGAEHREGARMVDAVTKSGADIRTNSVVWGIWDRRVAYVRADQEAAVVDADRLILATGARDRAVAFPGWTLPGVLTAGAAKSLVAKQLVLPGRRILMAGSGPLALAFSAQLLDYGANIVAVHEAAGPPRPGPLLRLMASADRAVLIDAARYRLRLLRARLPLHYRSIIVRAEGSRGVERAIVASVDRDWRVVAGSERSIEVDTILLGYGLETSAELSRLCGCEHRFDPALGGWVPKRDDWMQTSSAGIYAVGDGSAVRGSVNAELEGRLAGIAAARDLGYLAASEASDRAITIRRRLRRVRSFQGALRALYPLGVGLYELSTDDTVVCRCEEVTQRELVCAIDDGVDDPNVIRARTRIGMGRCQGRYCASHVAATIAARHGRAIGAIEPPTVRPPVKPVPVAAVAAQREQEHDRIELDG